MSEELVKIKKDWIDRLLAVMGVITVLLLICGASIAARAKKRISTQTNWRPQNY